LGEQGDEVAGVGVAPRVGPVGLVDGVFHYRLVEIAVGESVERVGPQAALLQPVFEHGGGAGGKGFAGGVGAEPQAHAQGAVGADLLLDGHGEAFEVGLDLGEGGAGVHVGAVAERGVGAEDVLHGDECTAGRGEIAAFRRESCFATPNQSHAERCRRGAGADCLGRFKAFSRRAAGFAEGKQGRVALGYFCLALRSLRLYVSLVWG